MRQAFRPAIAALLLAATPLAAQEAGGSAYAIGGIDVDVSAHDPQTARMAAFRIAQRKAWPLLWARMTGGSPGAAPSLSDGQLDSIVAGIESQGEHFSQTRYIARLGVVFDRSRASDYFASSTGAVHSPPMLLLPLQDDGAASILYQAKTPWRAAWQRYREMVTPVEYVLASGSAGDNLLLTSYQVHRSDRNSWRNILNRFDAVDVLTAEAHLVRQWPGGPVRGLFIARHGPDAEELGRFTMTAANEQGLDAMLDAAVREIDTIYSDALRSGRLKSEADLTADIAPILSPGSEPQIGALPGEAVAASEGGIDVQVATPDAASVDAILRELRGTPGLAGVTIRSLSLGGTSRLVIGYSGDYEMALYQLDQRGLRIADEGGVRVLRKRLPGEAPLPRPVTAAELSTSEAIDASEGESIAPTAPAPKPAAPRPAAVAAPAPPAPRPARRPATEPQAAPPPADQGPRDLLPKP